jgi:hypothetical protein
LYGQKALVVPALAELLLRELGAERLVMVPQETTTGLILAQLPRQGGARVGDSARLVVVSHRTQPAPSRR